MDLWCPDVVAAVPYGGIGIALLSIYPLTIITFFISRNFSRPRVTGALELRQI